MWFHAYYPGNNIDDYDLLSKMDFFCTGGFGGWMVATRFEKVKSCFEQIQFYQRTIITVLMVFLFYSNLLFPGLPFQYLYMPSISALLYACIILMAITTSWLIFEERSLISRLGRISYGMYVYHTVVIVALGALLKYSGLMVEGWLTKVTFAIIALGISIIVSHFSFRYFEKPFLRLKTRFRIKEEDPQPSHEDRR
jgi:peptidoglycan/LPS O-acetylase OafA/YrhL